MCNLPIAVLLCNLNDIASNNKTVDKMYDFYTNLLIEILPIREPIPSQAK